MWVQNIQLYVYWQPFVQLRCGVTSQNRICMSKSCTPHRAAKSSCEWNYHEYAYLLRSSVTFDAVEELGLTNDT